MDPDLAAEMQDRCESHQQAFRAFLTTQPDEIQQNGEKRSF
jgi:hypothetical protein